MTQIRWLVTIIVALCVVAAGGATLIFSGIYNVAATSPHTQLTQWLLHTTMERSVSTRAKSISAPEQFTPEQIKAGFSDFDEMCVTCHGAPGKEPGEIGKGLNPQPPNLAQHASHWSNAEVFWILKNGVKMTGMPAFGPTHSDDRLWSIVAFIKQQLPQLTPEDYAKMDGVRHQLPSTGDHDHEHDHKH